MEPRSITAVSWDDVSERIAKTAKEGLTLPKLGQLLWPVACCVVREAEDYMLNGAHKKLMALGLAKDLLAVLVPAVPLPWWLRPIAPIIRPVLARWMASLVDGLIEAAVQDLRALRV